MAVQKFRSVAEMNAAPVATRFAQGDTAFDRFLRHCARYRAIARSIYPGGVFRFRTLQDAQDARAAVRLTSPPTGGTTHPVMYEP